MSCLFESLVRSAGIVGVDDNAKLRRDLVSYIAKNAEIYASHIEHEYNESVEQYCARLSNIHEQGDYIMLCAFIHLYEREVHLRLPSGAVHILKSYPDSVLEPVVIAWQPGHYYKP